MFYPKYRQLNYPQYFIGGFAGSGAVCSTTHNNGGRTIQARRGLSDSPPRVAPTACDYILRALSLLPFLGVGPDVTCHSQ